jgi:hypothetical protein
MGSTKSHDIFVNMVLKLNIHAERTSDVFAITVLFRKLK